MLHTIIEWFKNLDDTNKIAIVVPVGLAAIGGLFVLFKWLFSKKNDSPAQQKTIKQNGQRHTAIFADDNKGNVAGRDIHTGIGSQEALNTLVEISAKLGRSEKEKEQFRERVKQLEEQLAKPSLETNIASQQSTPVPSTEAKEISKLINEDDGPYAQALKAIAEGNNKKADGLLDETQRFVDHHIQQAKDKAQTKIFIARMQNASYAGRPQDALQYCDKLKPLVSEDSQILNEMAAVYNKNAMYEKAEPMCKRALAIDEASFGKDHPNVARDLNNLAQLYKATNRLSEAEPLMKRALAIDEARLGKDHPNVAIDLNNLAQLYQATNRLSDAEPLMKRALVIDEARLGKNHPDVAIDLNNLAQLYQDTNRLSKVEPLMKRALVIWEKSLGENHPQVATALNNLALLYDATNRLAEAEPLMKRALAIDEARLGKDHPDVARDLNNLAMLYQATNRLSDAEPMMKRVVEIVEKSLGKDHPNVATGLNNLAALYQATNRLSDAEPLMERHLVIFLQFTRQTGHPHPHLKDAVNNYAGLLTKMGYSKDEITARLNRLAPEMFKSK